MAYELKFCSPLHTAMNARLVVSGVLMLAGCNLTGPRLGPDAA